jgi:hypothetical protein
MGTKHVNMGLTTDPNDSCLKAGRKEEGQNTCYLVLSEEERAKGFVRPYRESYVHVGKMPHYKGVWYMLDEEKKKEFPGKDYVAVMTVILNESGDPVGGSYVTQEELDAWKAGKRVGGCGTSTRMGSAIAETYARNPSFYGATFCIGCNTHLPVEEFFWQGTEETVGS